MLRFSSLTRNFYNLPCFLKKPAILKNKVVSLPSVGALPILNDLISWCFDFNSLTLTYTAATAPPHPHWLPLWDPVALLRYPAKPPSPSPPVHSQ